VGPGLARREEETDVKRMGRYRRPSVVVALAAGALAIITGVLVWFQPHKLLINQRVPPAR